MVKRNVVEINRQRRQGQHDDDQAQQLGGPVATWSFDIEAKQRRAEQREAQRGIEGHAAWREGANGAGGFKKQQLVQTETYAGDILKNGQRANHEGGACEKLT